MTPANCFYLMLSMVIATTACAPKSIGSSAPKVSRAEVEGGIDGGGGGTLPANPISLSDAKEIIREAKTPLLMLIKGQEFSLSLLSRRSSLETKLFGSKPNIWDITNDTDIEILTDRACKDASGQDVDGSVHSSLSNAICISTFRIAPKLIKERARTEIYALILHELSHKLGTTEAEAREYQRDASVDLERSSGEDSAVKLRELHGLVYSLETKIYALANHAWDREAKEQYELVRAAVSAIYEIEIKASNLS